MPDGPKAWFTAQDGLRDVVIDLLESTGGEQDVRMLLRSTIAERVPLESLDLAGSPRSLGEDRQHTRRLVESATSLPPIVAHRSSMRVVDGVHRVQALRELNESEVDAYLFDGDDEVAFLLGVKLNVDHGLPLTLQDRRVAAGRIIRGHPEWSDRVIASMVGLSDKTVGAHRKRLTAEIPQLTRRIGRDGRSRPVGPDGGRRRASRLLQQDAGATPQEAARPTGLTPGATQDDARSMRLSGQNPPPLRHGEQYKSSVRGEPEDLTDAAAAIIAQLRRDPSLRQTDVGRVMLRSLAPETLKVESDARLADRLPSHLLEAIANLAEMRAEVLQMFAARLRQRRSRV